MSRPAMDGAPEPVVPLPSGFTVASLAVVLGLMDVLLLRGFVRVADSLFGREPALALETVGRFVRNAAALATAFALAQVVRATFEDEHLAVGRVRRMLLGGFVLVVMLVLISATVMSDDRVTLVPVLAGLVTGYLGCAVAGLTCFDSGATPVERGASAWLVLLGLAAAIGHAVSVTSQVVLLESTAGLVGTMRTTVEVCFFALPLTLAFAAFARRDGRPSPARIATAAVAAAITLIAVRLVALVAPNDLGILLYGAFRLDVLSNSPREVYAVLLGLYVGGATLAVGGTATMKRLGLGAFALLAAGAGPASPYGVALTLLAACIVGLRHDDEGAEA